MAEKKPGMGKNDNEREKVTNALRQEDRMVTAKEAANILGIDRNSVLRIVRKGKVRAEKRPIMAYKIYVSLMDLLEYRRNYGKFGPQSKKK